MQAATKWHIHRIHYIDPSEAIWFWVLIMYCLREIQDQKIFKAPLLDGLKLNPENGTSPFTKELQASTF